MRIVFLLPEPSDGVTEYLHKTDSQRAKILVISLWYFNLHALYLE